MNFRTGQEAALKRILAIQWEYGQGHTWSSVRLLEEYLRRSALWFRSLGGNPREDAHRAIGQYEEAWKRGQMYDEREGEISSWPLYSVAGRLSPDATRLDESVEHRLDQSLVEHGMKLQPNVRNVCRWYLEWSGAESCRLTCRYTLDPPYEPLIRMYERGRTFTTEKGRWIIDHEGMMARRPYEYYLRSFDSLAMDDLTLDALDDVSTWK